MKRFRFPLRPVAVIRAHRELVAQQALGVATAALTAAETEVANCRNRLDTLNRAIAGSREGGLRVGLQVAALQAYKQEKAGEVAALKQQEQARAERARRHAVCVEAHRALKVVQKLEERARARHQAEMIRQEQSEIDERAAFAAVRSRSSHP